MTSFEGLIGLETPATLLYWDVTADIELKLLVKDPKKESKITRVYTAKKSERTYTWPSAGVIEKAVNASVADIASQIQSDTIWDTISNDAKLESLGK